jgi:luciferase family oxidoreductase group 1
MSHRVPLSVLDLSVVRKGASSTEALLETTELVRHAERLGYTRFWVAEHHNMSTIASTSPPVLMAHIASVTSHIRIGSGGVMLPNHASLAVAEQFAMLEALHPNRIDLGIGRAPGTTPAVAAALRRSASMLGAEDFPSQLIELMGLLGDPRVANDRGSRFIATPKATSWPSIILLGSSDYSAQFSAELGLPFAFAHHFDTGGTLTALDLYRDGFKPSHLLDEPYAIVTTSVLVADTAEEAFFQAAPGLLMSYAIRTGRPVELMSPEEAMEHPDLEAAKRMPSNRIYGTPEQVLERVEDLQRQTQASELMISNMSYSLESRVRSLELLAEIWKR